MIDLKDSTRYTMLLEQFNLEKTNPYYLKINDSLERFFYYIYNYTDILYIDFINEKVIYDYIIHHRKKGFKINSFQQTIKDVKTYLFFLKYIKRKKQIPSVDLSVENLSFMDGI